MVGNSGIINFVIKNTGLVDSEGYGHNNKYLLAQRNNLPDLFNVQYDWHRIFEVTTNIELSQRIESLPAGTPIYVNENNKVNTYYFKDQDFYNIKLLNDDNDVVPAYTEKSNNHIYLISKRNITFGVDILIEPEPESEPESEP